MKPYTKVSVNGTFDILHKGHALLLKKAFESDYVLVGLTSDGFCKIKKNVRPYNLRYNDLKKYLDSYFNKSYEIIKIDDIYGYAIYIEDLEAIIVSEETYPNAVKINDIREKKHMKKLDIVKIAMLKDKTGVISSSRLRK